MPADLAAENATLKTENAVLKAKLQRAETQLDNRRLKEELKTAAQRKATAIDARATAADERRQIDEKYSTADIGPTTNVVFVAADDFAIPDRNRVPASWPTIPAGQPVAMLQLPAGDDPQTFIQSARDGFIGDAPSELYPPQR